MIWLAIAVWVGLQILSRWSLTEWNSGLQVQVRGSPMQESDWEWFDWLPKMEKLETNTEDEKQGKVRYFTCRAAHGKVLFIRWSVRWLHFKYEMTRAEYDELTLVQPVIEYDKHGKERISIAEQAKRVKHEALKAQYCAPGRRIQKR